MTIVLSFDSSREDFRADLEIMQGMLLHGNIGFGADYVSPDAVSDHARRVKMWATRMRGKSLDAARTR